MKTLQVECRKALNSCSLLRSDPAGLLGKHREVALARLGSGGVDGDPSYGEDLCDHGSRKGCGQRGKGLAEHAGINGRRFGILEAPGGRSAVQGGAVRCGAVLLVVILAVLLVVPSVVVSVRPLHCVPPRRFLSLRAQPLLSSTAKKDSSPPSPHRIPKSYLTHVALPPLSPNLCHPESQRSTTYRYVSASPGVLSCFSALLLPTAPETRLLPLLKRLPPFPYCRLPSSGSQVANPSGALVAHCCLVDNPPRTIHSFS